MTRVLTAIGLMSGTSMDGVDLACLRTDGEALLERGPTDFMPYPDEVRDAIRACLGLSTDPDGRVKKAEDLVTGWHIKALKKFIGHKRKPDLIGFHGQTIFHDPANHKTWQIGDGKRLSSEIGVDVIYDFRSNDMKAGGQGAPLLPLYHRALVLAAKLDMPACILNLGGVGNLTWIDGDKVYACDTGPGNALLDDWMLKKTGVAMDKDGLIAMSGEVDTERVKKWMTHPYFAQRPPKSLDRNAFAHCTVDDMSLEDGAATLVAFTVVSAINAWRQMPTHPHQMIVAGGGRKNKAIMQGLGNHVAVITADQLGWSGDALEAEGFAYLAVRSLNNRPLTLPTTTGCRAPTLGGKYIRYKPESAPLKPVETLFKLFRDDE